MVRSLPFDSRRHVLTSTTKTLCFLTACILLADPQESFDYAVELTARHGLLVLVSQPQTGIKMNFE